MSVGSLFSCFMLFSCIKLSTFFSKVCSSIITIALLLPAFTIVNLLFLKDLFQFFCVVLVSFV